MGQFRQLSAFTFSTIVLVSLPIYVASQAAVQPMTPMLTSGVDAMALSVDLGTHFMSQTAVSRTLVAQATGNLLSPKQKAQLTQLPIPIVAPTVLPASFRLVRAEGEAGKYANGDDDSGYAIDYEGAQNTCLSMRSSKDGPRGLEKVTQVQTRFGLVTVYQEKLRDGKSLVSFLGLKGNPTLVSGGTLPDNKAPDGWKRCRAVSVETYTQVLKSLAVVK
jgi:hypothetical protein